MFARFRNSWELVKASFNVLRADKELLVFPVISGIVTFFVSLTFIIPTIAAGLFDNVLAGGFPILAFIFGLLFYAVQYFVVFFFNSALVGAAMIRLEGGDPTVGDGLRIAVKHLPNIIGYSLIAATVGVILRSISERNGIVVRIVAGLIGAAWNIATFLVVPVLVVEGVGPITALKRSVTLLKKSWGEQIAGNISIGLIFGLLSVPIIILGILGLVASAALNSLWLMVPIIIIMVVSLTGLGLVNGALSGIYSAAVYQYASSGKASAFFDEALIAKAFKQR